MAKTGRPKGNSNLEHVCTIRFDRETYERLEAYCKMYNMHKSEAIRNAITKMTHERGIRDE